EVALYGAGGDAKHRREECQHEAEENGYPEAVDDARGDIAALIVEAEPVGVAERLEAGDLLGRGFAKLGTRGPRRRCRIAKADAFAVHAARIVLIDRVVGIAD